MIENLPRQMLWSDFKTIDKFYKVEPLNKRFHEALKTIALSLFNEKKDDTMVFNEVYYQLTRMAYERALPAALPKYEMDIRQGMGSNDGVDLVMSMAYHLMSLVDKDSRLFNSFLLLTIKERYEKCSYWKPFSFLYTRLSKGKRRVSYNFTPRPVPAKELTEKYVHWQEITGDYNAGVLLEILSLWNGKEEKRLLFEMISSSVKFSTPKIQQTFYNQVEPIIRTHLFGKDTTQEGSSELEKRIKDLDSTVMLLKKENALFQSLIRDLEADNERMKSLLEDYKQNGSVRKFTFAEIVNYCKEDEVEWGEARLILNMLKDLLRENVTKEDYDMMDSVRAHFKNKRNGDQVQGNKTSFGNNSNMWNFNLPENTDYEKFFAALPEEVKKMMVMKFILKDNG